MNSQAFQSWFLEKFSDVGPSDIIDHWKSKAMFLCQGADYIFWKQHEKCLYRTGLHWTTNKTCSPTFLVVGREFHLSSWECSRVRRSSPALWCASTSVMTSSSSSSSGSSLTRMSMSKSAMQCRDHQRRFSRIIEHSEDGFVKSLQQEPELVHVRTYMYCIHVIISDYRTIQRHRSESLGLIKRWNTDVL